LQRGSMTASGVRDGTAASGSSPSCPQTCSPTHTATYAACTRPAPRRVLFRGSGGGVTHTTSFTLTVTAPFDFSLANGGDRSVTRSEERRVGKTGSTGSWTSPCVTRMEHGLPEGTSASNSRAYCTQACCDT